MSNPLIRPTRVEIDDAIIRAHRMRAEYTAELFRSAFRALRAIPARIAAALHRPAHS